jgi:molecular chaperone DnaK
MKMGEAIYGAGDSGGEAGAEAGEASGESGEDVVDAEFEEVDDDKKSA